MDERRAFILLATGSQEHGPVHIRSWEVPADEAAMEKFAETLTSAYGSPGEWVSDEMPDGRLSMLIYDDGSH